MPARHREAHERGLQRYLQTGKSRALKEPVEATARHRDGHESGASVPVTASVGLAMYPDEAEAVSDLIEKADEAMYAAKRQRHRQTPAKSRGTAARADQADAA